MGSYVQPRWAHISLTNNIAENRAIYEVPTGHRGRYARNYLPG